MDVEIKKIVIRIGNKELYLTPDEAKELMKVLDDTFGVKEIRTYLDVVTIPYNPPYRWVYWSATVDNAGTYILNCNNP